MSGDETVVHDHNDFDDQDFSEMESGESPVEDEQEDGETESSEDEGSSEQDDTEAEDDQQGDDEDDSSDEPGKQPEGKDKALQKLQQRQTTFEREVKSGLDALTKAIEKLGSNPTAKQEQKVEDAKDDLAELLETGDDDDIVDMKTLKKLVGKLSRKQDQPDLKQAVDEAIAERERAKAQRESEIAEYLQKEEADFNEEYPELDGRFSELSKEASKHVQKRYGELEPEDFERKYRMAFAKLSAKALAEAESKAKPSPARKAGTLPPKSAKGANTTTVGASASKSGGSKVVFHDNDMESTVHDLSPDD